MTQKKATRQGGIAQHNSASHYTRKFNRNLLPDPVEFYPRELDKLKLTSDNWVMACCPFHDDNHASLSVSLQSGGFKCFACGESGGSVLDFTMQLTGASFVEAVTELGAWDHE